jgi:hypothetical protein
MGRIWHSNGRVGGVWIGRFRAEIGGWEVFVLIFLIDAVVHLPAVSKVQTWKFQSLHETPCGRDQDCPLDCPGFLSLSPSHSDPEQIVVLYHLWPTSFRNALRNDWVHPVQKILGTQLDLRPLSPNLMVRSKIGS